MYKTGSYRASDPMAQLVCDNFVVMPILSRLGIPLGFADKSIDAVCQTCGVDTATFLAIVNVTLREKEKSYRPKLEGVDIACVVFFLRASHHLYLNQRLPAIRAKLLHVVEGDKLSTLILRYFDDYVMQIQEHLHYEEQVVFPYIEQLTQGGERGDYSIECFSSHHDHIDEPLREFKDVIIKYYSGDSSDAMVEIIHDLLACVKELARHNIIEDRLLVPLIRRWEEGVL